MTTAESRFLELPMETRIGSRNQEFEKSKVASNYAKMLRYCFSGGSYAKKLFICFKAQNVTRHSVACKFSEFRVIEDWIFPREPRITSSLREFRVIEGSTNRGEKLECWSEANPRETTTGSSHRELRQTEGSRNRDSTVHLT